MRIKNKNKLSVFEFIENISDKCAYGLWDKKDEDDKEFWLYWVNVFFTQIATFSSIMVISILMKTFIQSIIICIIFIFIRSKIGGYHSCNFKQCWIMSQTFLICGGILAKYTTNYLIIMFVIGYFCAMSITDYIPKRSNENVPERGELRKQYFRKIYKQRVLFFYVMNAIFIYIIYKCNIEYINIFIWDIDIRLISSGISSGMIMMSIAMSDTFERIMKKI